MAYHGGLKTGAVDLILSPWPEAGSAEETRAVEFLNKAVDGLFSTDGDESARLLGATAAARVEREAPNAPQPIKNMAMTRYCGYLAQSDYGGVRSERLAEREVEYVTNHRRAWINSGASEILSPWKPLGGATIRNSTEAEGT